MRVASMGAFVSLLADHMHRKDVARRRRVKCMERIVYYLIPESERVLQIKLQDTCCCICVCCNYLLWAKFLNLTIA